MLVRVYVDHELVHEAEQPLPFVVGRGPGAELTLDDPRVDERHGRVFLHGATARYEDLGGRGGSWVAGGPRLHGGEHFELSELTQVLVGDTVLELVPGPAPAPTAAVKAGPEAPSIPGRGARLVVPGSAGVRAMDIREATTVGSDPSCDLVLDHPALAPRQAEVRPNGQGWELRDLAGDGSTRVGLAPVEGPRLLPDPAHVILGPVDVLFTGDTGSRPDDPALVAWMARRGQLHRAQVREVRRLLATGQVGLAEALVARGMLPPGPAVELLHNARQWAAAGAPDRRRPLRTWGPLILAAAATAAAAVWWLA